MLALLWRFLRYLVGRIVQPPPSATPREPTPESVFHDAVVRLLDVQINTNNALDTRNGTTFSVASTVLPVTVGLLNLGMTRITGSAIVALAAALGCYVLLLVCSGRASAIRGLEFRPHLLTLSEHSQAYPGNILQQWVAQEYLASTEANGRQLARKARWVGAASVLLYIEGFFLSLAALLTLL